MIKININGPILGTSGYDSHTRSLANALYKVADVRLTTQFPNPDWNKMVNDAELDMVTKKERVDDYNILVSMPHMWKLFMGTGKNIGYCVWEGDKVPESWIEEFLNPKIHMIFVPSEHTKKAIEETLQCCYFHNADEVLDKIKVIPHGVDKSVFNNEDLKKNDGVFRFICNKGWRGTGWDRGGVQYLIKAFAEEFSKDEKVQLIVKLNPAYIQPQIVEQSIQNLNLQSDRAQIHINCSIIPFNKLKDLYNQADCFVCCTRSEAFNLPGLEAMSCELPTIQTNFGGQTDYMSPDNSLLIDYNLENVKEDLMYEEIQWATPKIESIKKQLRWAFENQEKIKEMGKQAEIDSNNFTWDLSAQKIITILSKNA